MSSLFSGLSGTTATSSQTQAGQNTGLFGNSSTTQPQQTPSFFANLGSSQPQQQSTLFSSTGNQSKPPASGGLFPNHGSGNAAPGTSGSSSTLFGNPQTAASISQQAPNLFAPQNTTSTSHVQGGSIFGNPTQAQSNPQVQPTPGQSQNEATNIGQPAFFDSLLEKGKKRTLGVENPGLGQLPSLQLGLGDIGRRVKELGASPQARGRNTDSKAHYLLAASGINPGTIKRDINAFQASTFVPPDVLRGPSEWDPDTDKVINQMHQRMSEKMMAEEMERSRQNFNRFLEENMDINMVRQRQKIMEHFGLVARNDDDQDPTKSFSSVSGTGSFGNAVRRKGLGGPNESGIATMKRSTFGKSSLQKSVIGTPTKSPGKATLFADQIESPASRYGPDVTYSGEKQRKYAEKTRGLNQSRLQEKAYPVLHEYLSVESQYGGEVCRTVTRLIA